MGITALLPTSSSDSKKERDGDVLGEVIWTVAYDVDDYDGPGWYITSKQETEGPIKSKSEAVESAFQRARQGDVIKIWEKDKAEPDLKYVN